jgi:hypothetical protein
MGCKPLLVATYTTIYRRGRQINLLTMLLTARGGDLTDAFVDAGVGHLPGGKRGEGHGQLGQGKRSTAERYRT